MSQNLSAVLQKNDIKLKENKTQNNNKNIPNMKYKQAADISQTTYSYKYLNEVILRA